MMAKFIIDPNVLAKAAKLVIKPTDEIAGMVADEAKLLAPSMKIWHNMGDEAVRKQHRHPTDGQKVPANLRFELPTHPWDREHRIPYDHTYMRFPKDYTSRAVVNIVNCRCQPLLEIDPDGVARLISTEKAVFNVDKVTAKVVCEGDLVVQSEVGTVYDGDLVAHGEFFMRKAAWTVRNKRNRAARRRR